MSPVNTDTPLAAARDAELAAFTKANGAPDFRVRQIRDWVCRRHELAPERMTNLPPELRNALKTAFPSPSSRVIEQVASEDGATKLLIELADRETVEMVIIPTEKRLTFCLSTQVGCPVGCFFCASGRNGLVRNLSSGEIIEEVFHGAALSRWPDNLVFMGSGEGLLNFRALTEALDLLADPEYYGMGVRHMTISSSGYVAGIRRLAELGREYNLAISLHAPNDEVRSRLIPAQWCAEVADIMEAADFYLERTGRMVTLEYTLISGINDSMECAAELGALARAHRAKINLIACNDTGSGFRKPDARTIRNFFMEVKKFTGHVTLRRSRGDDAASACGQLRAGSLREG